VPKQFKGVVKLDVRDSTEDWDAFREEKAPDGAPNVLIILYDDTGVAAWSPFGGRIEMPTLQRLADGGVTYSQWHTTALCSPTRSCFLTGRNHHQNGFAQIAEGAQGFPGHSGHIPMENAAVAEVLRERGWNTFWLGKNHNVPVDEWSMAASKRNWPLARGFDRFYGFIGGETNQWYPNLVEDNHYIDQPYSPRRATTCRRTWPTTRSASSVTASSRPPRSPGSCGSVPARTTRLTTPRRSGSTSTRAGSTTATRPTANGRSPG
jgi:arylsulfatase